MGLMQTEYVSVLAKINLSFLDLQKSNSILAQNLNLMEKCYTQQIQSSILKWKQMSTWPENHTFMEHLPNSTKKMQCFLK